ncbi:UNVERIFIED_ORG: uncharacterized protein DUF732 [Nocardia globerula]|uniref:Uncharacterized protein DUF732 n=1 Tax=Nocardia globerula TaxID=1818 RepID=A0A652YHY4_NOCGL
MSSVNHAKIVLAALAIGAALTACSTSATSSSDDATYLESLKGEDIAMSDDKLVDLGREVCDAIEGGKNLISLAMELQSENDALSPRQAGSVVGAATATYCVDFVRDKLIDNPK